MMLQKHMKQSSNSSFGKFLKWLCLQKIDMFVYIVCKYRLKIAPSLSATLPHDTVVTRSSSTAPATYFWYWLLQRETDRNHSL